MKLSAALEQERQREAQEQWNKIYVHHDGKFYHIYEWSAWLVKTVVCTEEFQKERGDGKILKASLYRSKGGEYAMLGFPVESLSKYIPEYLSCEALEGGDLLLTVALTGLEDYDGMLADFEQWRTECLPAERTKGNREITSSHQAAALARSGIFAIVARLLSYPVETKTPSENIEFISGMKQDLAALL